MTDCSRGLSHESTKRPMGLSVILRLLPMQGVQGVRGVRGLVGVQMGKGGGVGDRRA
jgi:hypothetical protein